MESLKRDTDRSAERVQMELLGSMSPNQKIGLLVDACETNRKLMLAGLRARNPGLGEAELHRLFVGLLHGEETAARVSARLTENEE